MTDEIIAKEALHFNGNDSIPLNRKLTIFIQSKRYVTKLCFSLLLNVCQFY